MLNTSYSYMYGAKHLKPAKSPRTQSEFRPYLSALFPALYHHNRFYRKRSSRDDPEIRQEESERRYLWYIQTTRERQF
ncbi:uncharacterized protein FOMMEDRAFT_139779 [Fomitiporia mediterranea MF3/22]|uniref:uncharacterized protein n=1 Tax=Fomitiporia mediterranea (strain MF3/22) TaxID=694068 RepID=UPI0004408EBA|nr:uncharacterized protein FOMMEDRAFT_139779 [Fomitiporia mediterranea MF3/22]EJD03519.1 hypothetical protein FOMMEDRAFT_139779 [Fomitiporia mediterranea MF3/22]